jgi:hypothetical protein
MEPDLEILYRKCSAIEANRIGEAMALPNGRELIRTRRIQCRSDKDKWVSFKRSYILNYQPNGSHADDYTHAAVLFVAPGTTNALQIMKAEGEVKKGPRGAYGIPPEYCKWFNNRVIATEVYDMTQQGLPPMSAQSVSYLLMDRNGDGRVFLAFPSVLVEDGAFTHRVNRYRMTWIKTSLLWTLWRSDWGTKQGMNKILQVPVSAPYLNDLMSNAAPGKATAERATIYQDDPDRRIIGRRWQRNQPYFVKAGRTRHFGLRNDSLERFIEEVCPGNLDDITVLAREIEAERPKHPRHSLMDRLGLEERRYSLSTHRLTLL